MVNVLNEYEIQSLGLSSVVHNGQMDEDNPAANAASSGVIRQDQEGRQIISYKQLLEFRDMGVPLHNYAMQVQWPATGRINIIQASKLQKWWGIGFRPLNFEKVMKAYEAKKAPQPVVEETEDEDMSPRAKQIFEDKLAELDGDEVVTYRCKDKYPDCKRFFDSQKGLIFHWQRDHGELSLRKAKEAKKAE